MRLAVFIKKIIEIARIGFAKILFANYGRIIDLAGFSLFVDRLAKLGNTLDVGLTNIKFINGLALGDQALGDSHHLTD